MILLKNFFNVCNRIIPSNKKQICFFSAYDYEDSVKSVYERLLDLKKTGTYEFVWILNNIDAKKRIPGKFRAYKYGSLSAVIMYFRSKYIFKTHSLYGNQYCKSKQIMVNLWHGMPIKGINRSDLDSCEKNDADYVITTSPFFNDKLYQFVRVDCKKYYDIGLPRNDELFNKLDILSAMGIDKFDKRIIWMPTFRRRLNLKTEGVESDFGLPCINREDLPKLNSFLVNENIALIIKLHPWAYSNMIDMSDFSNLITIRNEDIPNGYSLYNLIGATDALITDYSSVYVDYLLTDKPIAIAFDDYDAYSLERFFSIEPLSADMPGNIIRNNCDLIEFISNQKKGIDEEFENRMAVKKRFHTNIDSNSGERLIKLLNL